jgi:hypothetical protein
MRPDTRRERVVIGLVESRLLPVLLESLGKSRHEYDVTQGVRRLRRRVTLLPVERPADVDHLMVEVDVAPAKPQEFALSKSAEDRGGYEHAIAGRCGLDQLPRYHQ